MSVANTDSSPKNMQVLSTFDLIDPIKLAQVWSVLWQKRHDPEVFEQLRHLSDYGSRPDLEYVLFTENPPPEDALQLHRALLVEYEKRQLQNEPRYAFLRYALEGVSRDNMALLARHARQVPYFKELAAEVAWLAPQAQWFEDQDLNAKTVMIVNRSGLGDFLYVSRFIPLWCQAVGPLGKVVLVLRPELKRLFTQAMLLPSNVVVTDKVMACDYFLLENHCSIIWSEQSQKLPDLLPVRPQFLGHKKTTQKSTLEVGLIYHGTALPLTGTSVTAQHFHRRQRDIHLRQWSQYIQPRVQWHCLQYPAPTQHPDWLKPMPPSSDFFDLAQRMADMDVIVSVDTGAAHLAACLGMPVWMPCHYAPDPRFGYQGSRLNWYPSMRLFRQSRIHSWQEPLTHITQAAALLADLR